MTQRVITFLTLLQLLCWIQSCAAGVTTPPPPQKTIYDDLLGHLFSEYKRNAMPICTVGERLEVGQDMMLYQLFELDEPSQMLSVDVWVESTWRDCRLVWNPADFNGVSEFAIKSEEIWYPDLIFYESLHGNFEEGMFIYGESTARVYSDGWVRLGAQALFKAFCRVDISRFPYDSQRCNITFSSWTKDSKTFVLTRKQGESGLAQDHAFADASNGEWEVTGFLPYSQETARRIGVSENETAVYTEVVFQLQLKRKYLFHQTYMLFPCMLLTWLAAFGFFLPTESGERIAYVTTILLSLVVFLLLIADNIPRSGDAVPLLGLYFCVSVFLVSAVTLMVIASYNVSLKPRDFCPPDWLHRGCFRLGPFVGFRPVHHQGQLKVLSFRMCPWRPPAAAAEAAAAVKMSPGQLKVEADEEESGLELQQGKNCSGAVNMLAPETTSDVTGARQHQGGSNDSTWRYIGIVMDRVFFVTYACLNLSATIWILSAK